MTRVTGGASQPSIALVLAAYSPIWGSRSPRMRRASARAANPDECSQFLMTSASELRSGKTHRDENFPVASWIIHPRHRALILAFYNFVRTADDIADHATLGADEKLRYLDLLEAELLGKGDTPAGGGQSAPRVGRALDAAAPRARRADRVPDGRHQAALRELGRRDPLLPLFGHAGRALHARRPWREHLDLGRVGRAVRRAADQQPSCRTAPRTTKTSTASICRAMRWPPAAPPSRCWARRGRRRPLLQCLHALAVRTETLLNESKSLSAEVKDFRLGLEIAVIQAFADKIVGMLKVRDPLERARASEQARTARAERRRHRRAR